MRSVVYTLVMTGLLLLSEKALQTISTFFVPRLSSVSEDSVLESGGQFRQSGRLCRTEIEEFETPQFTQSRSQGLEKVGQFALLVACYSLEKTRHCKHTVSRQSENLG